jgi:adenylate cyclase
VYKIATIKISYLIDIKCNAKRNKFLNLIKNHIVHFNIPIISILLANIFTVILNSLLSLFVIRDNDAIVIELFTSQNWGLTMAPSFLIPTLLLYITFLPISQSLKKSTDLKKIPTSVKKLTLKLPLVGAFIGSIGWIIGIGITRILFETNHVPISEDGKFYLILVSIFVSVYSFSLAYFACDYYSKKYLFPFIFEMDEIFLLSKYSKNGLLSKFAFYFFSTVIFPMSVIYFSINSISGEAIQKSDARYMAFLVFIFIISGGVITFYIVQSLRKPLKEIQSVTESIRDGIFDRYLFVDSKDELGNVKFTLNSTSRELQEKEILRDIFGKMVDDRIRDHLMKNPPELGGIKTNVAILFSDIRNFTTFSEKLPPDQVVQFLNSYFDRMSSCIESENGIINKFIGDGILSFFGGILPMENPALSAYKAAKIMIDELSSIPFGSGNLNIGIGLHYGEVTLGNIGSKNRMEFTIIGNSVNLTSRLESLTKELKSSIAMSRDFIMQLPEEIRLSHHISGHYNLKGLKEKVEVYE